MKKRLSSSNLYKINPEFIHKSTRSDSHNLTGDSQILPIRQSDSSSINKTNIIKTSIIELSNKNIVDKIISSRNIDKQTKIIKLASLPLLEQYIDKHPYYIREAIQYQEQELRQKKILPKHIVDQAIAAAVSKTIKSRSSSYKAKVEYNKRNNLDWQGKPKK
jgi:hypothetical protein